MRLMHTDVQLMRPDNNNGRIRLKWCIRTDIWMHPGRDLLRIRIRMHPLHPDASRRLRMRLCVILKGVFYTR